MPRTCRPFLIFALAASAAAAAPTFATESGPSLTPAGAAREGSEEGEFVLPRVELTTGSLTLDAAADQHAGRPWTVQFEPVLWWTSPSGKLRLPGTAAGGGVGGDEVRVANLNLDTPRASPAGEVHLRADPWLFTFSGSAYSLTRSNTTADASFRLGDVVAVPGDALRVSFDYATAEVTVGRRVFQRDFHLFSANPADATPTRLSLYALGGFRLYDLDIAVTNLSTGVTSASEQVFIEPILGGRAVAELDRDFAIDLQVSGGYYGDSDRSASSLDISLAFHWIPHENVGVQIGWRQLLNWLDDGDGFRRFSYNGGLAGLYAGVVFRF